MIERLLVGAELRLQGVVALWAFLLGDVDIIRTRGGTSRNFHDEVGLGVALGVNWSVDWDDGCEIFLINLKGSFRWCFGWFLGRRNYERVIVSKRASPRFFWVQIRALKSTQINILA